MSNPQDQNFPIRKQIDTTEIETIAKEVSEEEFDMYLVQILHESLALTSWSDKLSSSKRFQKIPGLSHVPLICKTDNCEFASVCPIMRDLRGDPQEEEKKAALYDKECRVDLIESAKLFSQWIRELEIKPEDTTDLLQVTSLVRYIILQRRIEWEIQMCGVMMESVAGVAANGTVVYQKTPNALFKELATVQNMINSLTNQLSAARADKIKNKTAEDKLEQMLESLKEGYMEAKKKKKNVIDVEEFKPDDEISS